VIIKRGAEAELHLAEWNERPSVIKYRISKKYRNPLLDSRLRKSRIRTEVKLMAEARSLGISVPIIYDIDLQENKIVMEYIEGPVVKDLLQSSFPGSRDLCRKIGRMVGVLHKNDLVHGDLTTSNMILKSGKIYFIDFSLGEKTSSLESKGVDLHLLKEAFSSAHSESMPLFDEVLRGYEEEYQGAREVMKKMKEIEERGRYI